MFQNSLRIFSLFVFSLFLFFFFVLVAPGPSLLRWCHRTAITNDLILRLLQLALADDHNLAQVHVVGSIRQAEWQPAE